VVYWHRKGEGKGNSCQDGLRGVEAEMKPSVIKMLTAQQVSEAINAGVVPIDLRPHGEFAAGHVPGSINLVFSRKSLPERLATAIPPGPKILLVSGNRAEAEAAAEALSVIDRNPVEGILSGGIDAWRAAGLPLRTMSQLDVATLRERLATPRERPILIDCRESFEWDLGYIEGSLLIPLGDVWEKSRELDPGRETVLICEEGIRSSTGASVLLRLGFPRAANVPGGLGDWLASDYPTVRPPKAPTR
jgi:hydroxyacylglutathione hydrolase